MSFRHNLPMLKPVQRTSLADSVYTQLRDAIVAGDLVAGSALPSERALREQLGVNRGALREALKRLEEARLIRIRHGGATEVLDYRQHAGTSLLEDLLVSPDGAVRTRVARSIIEMRAALAPDIARLAARRASPDCLARLDAVLSAMGAAAGDIPRLQGLALDWWSALVDGSDNLAYRLAFNSLRDGYVQFMHLLAPVLAGEVGDTAAYRAITDAVIAHRERDAAQRAAALIAAGTGSMTTLLEALAASQLEDDA